MVRTALIGVLAAMAATAGSATQAALVDVSAIRNLVFTGTFLDGGISKNSMTSRSIGAFMRFNLDNLTARIDTTAQTGEIVNAAVSFSHTTQDHNSVTYQTGPPVFPNPAPTGTWSADFDFDPISLTLPTVAGSTVEPLVGNANGTVYRFSPTVTFSMPASFTVAGDYVLSSPNLTEGDDFSETFSRTTPGTPVTLKLNVSLTVGANFPTTASLSFSNVSGVTLATFAPASTDLIDASLEGVDIDAAWQTMALRAYTTPEPSSGALLAGASLALGWRRLKAVARRTA